MNSVLTNIQAMPKTLVLLPAHNENVERSIRNIDGVMYLRAQYVNIRDLLGHETIIMPKGALEVIESLLG